MRWLHVGKTVVPHPEKSAFVLIEEGGDRPYHMRFTLEEIATLLRGSRSNLNDVEVRFIKNDAPSIIWKPDDTLADTVLECERLDKNELRELAKLLGR